MHKIGQISLFIIIGILILIVAGTVFVLLSGRTPDPESHNVDTTPVLTYLQTCTSAAALDGLDLLGMQGGYHWSQVPSYVFSDFDIPYYWYNNQSHMPDITTIESELQRYIEIMLPICVNNLETFREKGLDVTIGKLLPTVSFGSSSAGIDVSVPISINSGTTTKQISGYRVDVPTSFMQHYNIVQDFMAVQANNSNVVPLSYLMESSRERGYRYELINLEPDTILYTFLFDNSTSVYAFVAQYNWSMLGSQDITIDPLLPFTINESGLFEHYVTAHGNNLSYHDYTSLFDINRTTGRVHFDTDILPLGETKVTIMVNNSYDRTYATMTFIRDY